MLGVTAASIFLTPETGGLSDAAGATADAALTAELEDALATETEEEVVSETVVENTSNEELIQNGEKFSNHSDIFTELKDHANLPREGEPNSSTDLFRDNQLVQRRYYDENGRALRDIDFSHSNGDSSHTFPHTHDWTWEGNNSTRSGH
jgi:hypothetical protein